MEMGGNFCRILELGGLLLRDGEYPNLIVDTLLFESLLIPRGLILCFQNVLEWDSNKLPSDFFFFFFFFYSHKIYIDKQLQYKSKGSMEIHDNPKTYT